MKVYFVGAGPGDPDLLTRKAERLLSSCLCCVYAGSLVSPEVLALLPTQAERYDSAKLSLDEILAIFRAAHANDRDVVRLHSGDPSIYGAIAEQMRELDRVAIAHEIVPGVSCFQAAAAALAVELTAPDVAQTIILTRVGGRTALPKTQELDRLAETQATLCVFLSIHKVDEVATTLSPHYGSDCPAAVVFRASWPEQKVLRGTLVDIAARTAEAGIDRTALIIVGRALAREAPASKLYDDTFGHGYRSTR